jgi:GDP-4-dehydro-6-deoxy-D-mannose reductase
MRVLVTGANGFLGGAIRKRLAARSDLALVGGAGRLDDPVALAEGLRTARPDIVVHAAGRTTGSADDFQADNVVATDNLARAIDAATPDCGLILLSSAAQYGHSADRTPWKETGPCNPVDDYGASKLAAEAAAFAATRRVAALRLFNVIAPGAQGEQAFSSFLRKLVAAMAGPPPWRVEMGRLSAVRDFTALDDALSAVERAIERDAWGEAINVCTGVGRPVRALLDEVGRLVAPEGRGALVISESGSPPVLDWSIGDPALCQARLGFTPADDLSALVRQAADWVRLMAEARANA